jgi:hypothetical protein
LYLCLSSCILNILQTQQVTVAEAKSPSMAVINRLDHNEVYKFYKYIITTYKMGRKKIEIKLIKNERLRNVKIY